MTGRMKIFNTRSYVWLIYAILWGMVWGYPVLTALVIAVREGTAVSWGGVFHDWIGIFPFFLLFGHGEISCIAYAGTSHAPPRTAAR